MANVISLDDVYTVFSSSKPTLYKAIVGLILSSGMNTTVLSRLTLNDFLNSCADYLNGDEKNFEVLLTKDPWEIIPCWKLKSEQRITFSTPESTFYIFLYLKEKRIDDLDNLDNPLFKQGDNNFLTSSKISSYVTNFNKLLNSDKDYFKSKNLIYTFEDIYDKHLFIEKEHKKELLDLFEGKLSNKTLFFRQNFNNNNHIKEYYKMIIPFLTARVSNFNNQFAEYYDALLKDKGGIQRVINEYYNNNLEEKWHLSYDQFLLLDKFAKDISNHEIFVNNDEYLNKLFKKALVSLIIYNYDFEMLFIDFEDIYATIDLKHRARIFEFIINKLKISDYFEITNEDVHKCCLQYLVDNNLYGSLIQLHKFPEISKRILFKVIDENNETMPIKEIKKRIILGGKPIYY